MHIQAIDDSTDETTALIQARLAYHRKHHVQIELIHRKERQGYKAGALAAVLPVAKGDFIAIFDADFLPPKDFLQQLIPYFFTDTQIGMVQSRWGHLNAHYSLLTRAQALTLDGHMVVEQTARYRNALPFNFNGSAGIWRRTCIEQSGGWQSDTLSEDLDLSYRAQMKWWRFLYISEVITPAEVPPQILAFKQQQFRWARGSIQVALKNLPVLWTSPLSFAQRLAGTLHVTSYLAHPLMILLLLTSLPLAITTSAPSPALGLASLAGFGPPLIYGVSQWAAYKDWHKRLAYFPFLLFIGVGVAFNNTCAILGALKRNTQFNRTPKFKLESQHDHWHSKEYALPLDWSVGFEIAFAIYAWCALWFAIERAPSMAPFLILGALGFSYMSGISLWQQFMPDNNSSFSPQQTYTAHEEENLSRSF